VRRRCHWRSRMTYIWLGTTLTALAFRGTARAAIVYRREPCRMNIHTPHPLPTPSRENSLCYLYGVNTTILPPVYLPAAYSLGSHSQVCLDAMCDNAKGSPPSKTGRTATLRRYRVVVCLPAGFTAEYQMYPAVFCAKKKLSMFEHRDKAFIGIAISFRRPSSYTHGSGSHSTSPAIGFTLVSSRL